MASFQDSASRSVEQRLSGQKVLIVHDERDIANYTVRILNRAGHEAACAFNEEQILDKLCQTDFDLVILDWSFINRDISKHFMLDIFIPRKIEAIYCSLEPRWALSTEGREVMNFMSDQDILNGVELRSERARFTHSSRTQDHPLCESYIERNLFDSSNRARRRDGD